VFVSLLLAPIPLHAQGCWTIMPKQAFVIDLLSWLRKTARRDSLNYFISPEF
jgi:hypothetical protein